MNTKDVKWKTFRFNQVFAIDRGFFNNSQTVADHGDLPFVNSQLGLKNGVSGYCSLQQIQEATANHSTGGQHIEIDSKLMHGPLICLTHYDQNIQAFYEPFDFVADSGVYVLKLRNYELNDNLGLFLTTCIEQQNRVKLWFNSLNLFLLKHSKIKLPVDNHNMIDFSFMNNYIQNLSRVKLEHHQAVEKPSEADTDSGHDDVNKAPDESILASDMDDDEESSDVVVKHVDMSKFTTKSN